MLEAIALICSSHEALVNSIKASRDETVTTMMIEDTGRLFEILTSTNGRTWTVIATSPQGNSCIVAQGIAFAYLGEPL